MPDNKILSQQDRAKLDGIVQKMISNKESESNIKFVVEDFKDKYGSSGEVKKKESSQPTSQENLWGSNSQPKDVYTSLVTDQQIPQQESVISNGEQPKMRTLGVDITAEEALKQAPKKQPIINKEIQAKIKNAKFKPKEYRNIGSKLVDKIATGSSQLGVDIASVPELIYEVAAAPQNAIASIFDIPSLKADSESFKKNMNIHNSVKDYYSSQVSELSAKSKELDQQYSQGVYDSFVNGNYGAGFDQLTSSFAESLPTTAAIMVGGAYAKAPQILATSTMIFGANKNEQLKKDHPELSTNARVANSLATGFAQAATETLGSASIGSAAKALVAREGKPKALSILKDGLQKYYKSALEKNPLTASTLGEGIEEWSSLVAENSIDVATGVKPIDYNVFEGGSDAFLGGTFGGAVFGTGLTGIKNTINYQDQKKIKENVKNIFDLQSQLENQNISPEIKQEINSKIEKLVLENEKYVQEDISKIDSLSSEVKDKLISATNTIDSLKSKAKEINESEDITEETKSILLSDLKNQAIENVQLKNSILDGTYVENRVTTEQKQKIEEVTPVEATEVETTVEETVAPTTEVTPQAYVEELTKTKESDPEAYWSVSEVSPEDAAKGTIIDTEDGSALVKPDGDIAGLFKKLTSKTKGVAQDLLSKAVDAGGIKLDNFDGYLTKQYEKAGFKIVSRVPFNEEYAGDLQGWNKEKHGTPDVVAMVYDPNNELDIEEKTFDDYDEAMAYRDSFVDQAKQNVKDSEDLTKFFDESEDVAISKDMPTLVSKAKIALSKILPKVDVVLYDNEDLYAESVGEVDNEVKSNGAFIGNKIHINPSKANGRTVAHEVFHAILLNAVKTDINAAKVTLNMINSVIKSVSPEVKIKLQEFVENGYDDQKELWNEEKLAELVGYLADNYESLSKPNKNLIKQWLDEIAKLFGLKQFTDNEVVDLLNAIAGKVSTGEVITEEDINVLGVSGNIFTKISKPRKSITNYIKLERFPVNKNTLFRENIPLSEFNGKTTNIIESDRMTGAYIADDKGDVAFKFFGGIYYPVITGKWWASRNTATADKIVKNTNKNRDADGYLYTSPIILGKDSHMSNQDMFEAVWEFMKHDLRSKNNNVTKQQFHKLVDKAFSVKKIVGKKDLLNIKPNDSIDTMLDKLDSFMTGKDFTFEERKAFIQSILGNPKVKLDRNFPSAGSISEVAERFTEPQTKKAGVHDIVMIMRTKGQLSYSRSNTSDEFYHKSYPVEITSSEPIEVIMLDGSYPLGESVPELIKSTGDKFTWDEYYKKHSKVSDKVAAAQYGRTAKLSSASGTINVSNDTKRKQINTGSLKEKLNEELPDDVVNKILSSLRVKFKDSYVVDLIDDYIKSKKQGKSGSFEESDFLLENGLTLNYIVNTLVEEGNFDSKRQALSYLQTIGETLVIENFIQQPVRKQTKSPLLSAIKKAKDAGKTDKAISTYLQSKGFTVKQITDALLKYSKDKAVQGQKAEGVFTREGRNNVITFLDSVKRRFTSARAFLPKSVFIAKEGIESGIKTQSKQAAYLVKDFDNALKNYKGDKDKLISDFDKFIRGEEVELPDEFIFIGSDMRNHIDNLSEMLIKSGAVDEYQADNITKNIGSYLTRSYEVFDKKDWAEQVDKEVIQAARNFLKKQLLSEAIKEADKSGLDVDSVLENKVDLAINDLIDREGAESFISAGKTGSKDVSILKQKTDIPLEIRALMGEYTDPAQNYSRTIFKIASLISNAKFLNTVKENGTGVFLFEKDDINRPKEFDTQIAAEGSETMNPLNGMYTTKEIAASLKESAGLLNSIDVALPFEISKPVKNVYEYYMKALGSVKWLKTIASVGTHFKNLTGNITFMLANGYFKPDEYRKSAKVIYNDFLNKSDKELREKMKEYTEAGIVDQSAVLGELRDMFKDPDFDKTFDRRMVDKNLNKGQKLLNTIKRYGKKGMSLAENAYQAEDDYFKIVAYETEKNRYAKAIYKKDFSELDANQQKEIVNEVSEIVKNNLPNYGRVPGAVKLIKAFPVVGTFVSFQSEALRTAYNIVNLAKDEIKSSNPEIRKIGAQRLAGIIASQAVKYGVMYLIGGAVTGDDEDKEKENAKRYVAPWSKNSNIIVKNQGDGKFSYIDISASDPFGGIVKPLNAMMSGDNLLDGFVDGLKELMAPFTNPDILKSMFTEISENKDAYGNELYNENDSFEKKSEAILSRVYKTFEPGSVTSARKISESDDMLNEMAGQFTGYKAIDVDLKKQFSFKIYDMKENELSARKIYTKAARQFSDKKITKEELDKAYRQSNSETLKLYQDLKKDYDAATYFGTLPKDLRSEMRRSKVGKNVIRNIATGNFKDIKIKQIPLSDEELKIKNPEAYRMRMKLRKASN